MSLEELKQVYLPNSGKACIWLKTEKDFRQYLQTYESRCTYTLNFPCWIVHTDESYYNNSMYVPLDKEIKLLKLRIEEITKDLQILENLS